MLRSFSRLVLCFDGDEAGRNAAFASLASLGPHLRDGIQVEYAMLPAGEDPDTLVQAGKWRETLSQSRIALADWLYERLQAPDPSTQQQERVREVISKLAPMPKSLLRADIANKLAHAMTPAWEQSRLEQELAGDQASRYHQHSSPASTANANWPFPDHDRYDYVNPPAHSEENHDYSYPTDSAQPPQTAKQPVADFRAYDSAVDGIAVRLFGATDKQHLVAAIFGALDWLAPVSDTASVLQQLWSQALQSPQRSWSEFLLRQETEFHSDKPQYSAAIQRWRRQIDSLNEPHNDFGTPHLLKGFREILHYTRNIYRNKELAADQRSNMRRQILGWMQAGLAAAQQSDSALWGDEKLKADWLVTLKGAIAELQGYDRFCSQPQK